MTVIDEIKARIDIVALVSETPSVKLRRSGKNWTGFCPFHANSHTPALVVFPETGTWRCFGSCDAGGTVIDWVMQQNNGWNLAEAVKHLAEKANIPLPAASAATAMPLAARVAISAREDVLRVAFDVFKRWLQADAEALAYARDRGWSDAAIKAGGLVGFSGRGSQAEYKEMRSEFSMRNIDPLSPAAVMILGFKGDVAAWAQAHGLEHLDGDQQHGMMGTPGIVYAHKVDGQVQYISRRQLPGHDKNWDGSEWKSYNPPTALAGEKQPFFNHLHKFHYTLGSEKGERIILVEGQGDAIAWGMMGVPAMALCGATWTALEKRGVFERLKSEYQNICFGTDADTPGEKVVTGKHNDFPLSTAFGPLLWVARLPKGTWKRPDGHEKALKDANDLAQWFADRNISEKWRKTVVLNMLGNATPIVLEVARYVGKQKGQFFTDALEKIATPLIMAMNTKVRNQFAVELAARLYPGQSKSEQKSAFSKLVGNELKEKKEGDDRLEEVPTFGFWLKDPMDPKKAAWVVDYIFEPVTGRALLAYRNPQGEIGTAPFIDIDGKRYLPKVDDFVRKGVVVFATALGPLKSTADLLFAHEAFLRRSFLLDKSVDYKMFSYYSLFTWVYDCFGELPFLRARGGKGTGKSAIMLRTGYICYRLCKSTGIGSTASLKHAQEMYKGTIFFDEMDIADKFDERIVMLNVRAMRDQAYVWSMKAVQEDGVTNYEPQAHNVYGPALITMYYQFADDATESRCLTFDLFEKDIDELKAKGVPRRLGQEWHKQAEDLRNMSLHWRLKHWQPDLEISDDLEDPLVSARANQITVPIKYIVRDDPKALEEITRSVREMYAEEILKRAESFEARFLEAILAVMENPRFASLGFLREAELKEHGHAKYIRYPDLAKVVNFLMDEMNSGKEKDPQMLVKEDEPATTASDEKAGGDKKEKKGKKKGDEEAGVSSKTVGATIKKHFRLPTARLGPGFVVVVWSQAQPEEAQNRIKKLRSKFGIDFIVKDNRAAGDEERYAEMAEAGHDVPEGGHDVPDVANEGVLSLW